VMATEKVTRKSLDAEDHRRLIQEALEETDFSELVPERQSNGGGREWRRSHVSTRRRCSRSRSRRASST
jgi:hypothetical protein